MTPENNPPTSHPDIKIDKPGSQGGTPGIDLEGTAFTPPGGQGGGKPVKIDQPGSEGGTAG